VLDLLPSFIGQGTTRDNQTDNQGRFKRAWQLVSLIYGVESTSNS
jgi:hypothetical protein